MIDSLRQVETPEGVELVLRVAGPTARAQAWLLDGVIKIAVLTALSIALGALGELGRGAFLLALFVVFWFYSVLFEVLWDGATPGKRSMGLRVVHDDGTPVGWPAAVIRSLVGFVDLFPGCATAGLVTMTLHPDFKRLGDIAAGTVVVYVDRRRRARHAEPEACAAPPVPLLPDEQGALVAFAERLPTLSSARARELAAILEPVLGRRESSVRGLAAYAAWITGRR